METVRRSASALQISPAIAQEMARVELISRTLSNIARCQQCAEIADLLNLDSLAYQFENQIYFLHDLLEQLRPRADVSCHTTG